MNTKRILSSVVTGLILTGSLAMAAPGNDRARSKVKVRAAKQTTTMTTGGHAAVRTRSFAAGGNTAVRTGTVRNRSTVFTGGNTAAVRTGTVRNRSTVFAGGNSFGFGYPYYSYGYYPYSYYGYYPYDYTFGYYYNQPAYGAYNGSIVVQVQTRLARAGYYHGAIDGVMGPRTRYAIQAYERDHGLRVDGVISGSLMRNMDLRY
jgi:Putative peptidoglycan binding domain